VPIRNGYLIDGGTVRLQAPLELGERLTANAVLQWGRRALDFVDAVDVNDEAWTQICSRRSVPGSMLVWQGLAAVDRRAVRDPVAAL
jgi:hypothetical protein